MDDKTLGSLSDRGMVALEVACLECSRGGRCRLAGLIQQHDAECSLAELKDKPAKNCLLNGSTPYFKSCSVYLPAVK